MHAAQAANSTSEVIPVKAFIKAIVFLFVLSCVALVPRSAHAQPTRHHMTDPIGEIFSPNTRFLNYNDELVIAFVPHVQIVGPISCMITESLITGGVAHPIGKPTKCNTPAAVGLMKNGAYPYEGLPILIGHVDQKFPRGEHLFAVRLSDSGDNTIIEGHLYFDFGTAPLKGMLGLALSPPTAVPDAKGHVVYTVTGNLVAGNAYHFYFGAFPGPGFSSVAIAKANPDGSISLTIRTHLREATSTEHGWLPYVTVASPYQEGADADAETVQTTTPVIGTVGTQ